ncbi:MAG TPA: nicotinamide-nucleotide amidohydrolase family protein, partial [bacterium]|nr:nicotinamide-nucleotide amidohydrolase family protein [bacterium]
PKNAVPLINRFGIALGFYIRHGRQWIMVLPGVPTELEKMFHQLVRPLLRQHFPGLGRKPELVVKIAGMSEPEIMTRLGDDFFKLPFEFGIYPELGEVSIRICAEQEKVVRSLRKKIKKRLGDSIYAWEDTPLAEITGRILSGKKKSVAVAESCTGGGFSSQLTTVSEASRYFKGGVVVYSNALKERLGVSKSLLRSKGAVSEEVAVQLAEKAREFAKTTYGIGITGVAGPTGGSKRKPVGLVYIAVAAPRYTKGWKQLFWGDRHQVQAKASKKALEYLWREIR